MVAGDIGMARQLTLQQRIFIVEQWLKHDRNPTATAAAFSQEFPNDVPPSQQSMHALAKKFQEIGSVTDKKRSGRPKNVNTDENKENVRTFYQNALSTSAVRASLQLHIPRTSLRRIMKDRILCLLLLVLGKATYGHSVKRLVATPVYLLLLCCGKFCVAVRESLYKNYQSAGVKGREPLI